MNVKEDQWALLSRTNFGLGLAPQSWTAVVLRTSNPVWATHIHYSPLSYRSFLSWRSLHSTHLISHKRTQFYQHVRAFYRTAGFLVPTESSKSDVTETLSSGPFLVKIFQQVVSDIQNTQNRTARDTLSQVRGYRQVPSHYAPFTPEDFDDKRQELQAAKWHLLSITADSICGLSWWKCAPTSSLTFTSRDHYHLSFPCPTQTSQIKSESLDYSLLQENMVLFGHNATISVQWAFVRFNPVSDSIPVYITFSLCLKQTRK